MITITNTVSSGSGEDDISHAGGGMWIRKTSRIWVIKDGRETDDLMSWLIDVLEKEHHFINRDVNISGVWVIKHPNPTFTNFRVDIPSKYLTNTQRLSDGKPTCELHYVFNFYSRGDDSKEQGIEVNATHFLVSRESFGNKGSITIKIEGSHKITNIIGDPAGIPPVQSVPGVSNEPEIPNPDPFDSDTPDPNISEPTPGEPEPGGEPEPSADIPEPDINEPDAPEDDKKDKDDEPDKPEGDTVDPDAPDDIPDSGDND